MPRRVVPPPAPSLAPPPLSPLVKRLRQDWRWAGLSQFVFNFSDAFGLVDWDIELLEKELDGIDGFVLPDLIAKMLIALTWNRQINRQNAFENLRKQYLKRDPENNPLGTVENPVEWAALGLDQQIQILWQLCEWQMVDPTRFRSLLKTEDEAPSWRVDPVGWDKHSNTYFLFDDNRLWVQRAHPRPPRPPKKTSLKAKRAQRAQRKSQPAASRSHKKRQEPIPLARDSSPPVPLFDSSPIVSGPRKRKQVDFYGNVIPTIEALKRGNPPHATPTDRSTRRSTRVPTVPSPTKQPPPRPLGTRVSRRLHAVDDGWQQIPDEWLASGTKSDADGDSELSDLTDEETHQAFVHASLGYPAEGVKSNSPSPGLHEVPPSHSIDVDEETIEVDETGVVNNDVDDEVPSDAVSDEIPHEARDETMKEETLDERPSEEPLDEFEQALQDAKKPVEGFIEWEAVCVTLDEWQTFPQQWARSKHPDEKALYQVLTEEVGPQIIEVLQAKELERIKQEAVNNRKRSSRIATRELERAELAKREAAEREMEERMEKVRQEEEQRAREEAEALERERAREARLREREERIAARQKAITERAAAEERERERAERKRERRKRRRDGEEVETSSEEDNNTVAPTPPAEENGQTSWELKCEVCKQQGWNLKDIADLVCCDDCGRWQHVLCHDRQDVAAGRGLRDWEQVDFRCQACIHRSSENQRRLTEAKRQKVDAACPSNQPLPPAPASHNHPTRAPPTQLTNGSPIPIDPRGTAAAAAAVGILAVNTHHSNSSDELRTVNGRTFANASDSVSASYRGGVDPSLSSGPLPYANTFQNRAGDDKDLGVADPTSSMKTSDLYGSRDVGLAASGPLHAVPPISATHQQRSSTIQQQVSSPRPTLVIPPSTASHLRAPASDVTSTATTIANTLTVNDAPKSALSINSDGTSQDPPN